jgi:DNA-binding transcriptional ArsR family regulator
MCGKTELVKDAALLRHPLRFRMVELLMQGPMSVRELVEALSEHRRLVSYHLLLLEEHGFVHAALEFPGEAVVQMRSARRYRATGKGEISIQFLFLDEQRVTMTEGDALRPELKGRAMRIYQATEKAEGALNALKEGVPHAL